jgi:predicted nucleic acid-binding protein
MKIVLDTGALIEVDRGGGRLLAVLLQAKHHRIKAVTSGAVVAQVWRNGPRQVNLSRTLTGIEVVPIDDFSGRRVGQLLAHARTSDIVDGHVALLVDPGDRLFTSDPGDLRHLIDCRNVNATLIEM